MKQKSYFEKKVFQNITFTGEKIDREEFTACTFENCVLESCTFTECKLIDCSFVGCRIINPVTERSSMMIVPLSAARFWA